VRLSGPLGAGWGVCANGQSSHDGGLVHQRDGCAAFAARAELQVASKLPSRRARREEARREEEDDAEARAGAGAAKGGE
jgi:hypothetical protein